MRKKLVSALYYAKKDIAIIPLHSVDDNGFCSCSKGKNCDSAGKHPRTKHGYKNATIDPNKIKNYWTKYPDSNIGIATGKINGIIVIDIDPRNGGDETMNKLIRKYGELPETWTVETGGGGLHYYFKYPFENKCKIPSSIGKGVDIKCNGGLVAAPNSNHSSGKIYKWKKGYTPLSELAELPSPWVKCLTQIITHEESDRLKMPEIIPEGARNETLFKFACSLRSTGLFRKEILDTLKKVNDRCSPPLSDEEVISIVSSAMKEPAGIAVLKKWKTPRELENLVLPIFPIECFPKSLHDYITSVAKSIQVPIDMVACAIIAVFSLGCSGKFIVSEKEDHSEHLNLFMAISAKTGERKSAVFNEIMRPIHEYQNEVNRELKLQIVTNRHKVEIIDKKISQLKNQYSEKNDEQIFKEIEKLEQDKITFSAIKELCLYAQDATPEKVAQLLQDNGERLGIFSSEGEMMEIWDGKYDNKGNISIFLKAFSGEVVDVQRIGRENVRLHNPLLTILQFVQPVMIEKMLSSEVNDRRGLTARFLYCLPESLIGTRFYTDYCIPEKHSENYDRLVKQILSLSYGKEPILLKLSKEAKEVYKSVHNVIEKQMNTKYQSIEGWANRSMGVILKHAGIIHVIENILSGKHSEFPTYISKATFKKAVKIGKYYLAHSKAAFENSGFNQDISDAKNLLAVIKRKGWKSFSHNKLFDASRGRNRFCKTENLDRGLRMLCEYGYLQIKYVSYSGKGRPRSTMYVVNPFIYGEDI